MDNVNKGVKKVNKKIKLTASAIAIVGLFSVASPYTNILSQKVSASERRTSLSDRQLRSIYLSEGDINFSASNYEYNVEVKEDVDDIRITAKPRNNDSTVSIDGSTVNYSDNYKEKVDLDYGKNEIKIKVEDENGKEKIYVLNIYRGTEADISDDEDEDNSVYLKELKTDSDKINFDKKTLKYYFNVPNEREVLKITAVPDCTKHYYDDYSVKIDNDYVDNDDGFTKEVSLEKGENDIQIVVKDKDDNDKIYNLIIIRGSEISKTASSYNYLDVSKHDTRYDPIFNNINANIIISITGF